MSATQKKAQFDFKISALTEADSLAVKALINEQAPHAPYASYYPAMLANFIPDLSAVSTNADGKVSGAVLGMYDWNFNKLILSHVVSALQEASKAEQAAMLKACFANAATQGISEVTAHLDMVEDTTLAEIIQSAAQAQGLKSHVNFNGDATHQPDEIIPEDRKAVKQALRNNPNVITYRKPTLEDAHRVWSLVHYINQKLGGLDIYDRSNYERLFRDTPETCMVAEYNGEIGGFATGFAMAGPNQNKGLFMWQTGSLLPGAGYGCEERLLDTLRPQFLNFTVEADNGAANGTAIKKAKHLGMAWSQPRAIESNVLGGGHNPEVIYTVAPNAIMPQINRQFTL